MFNSNILQDQINSVAATATFANMHLAIRDSQTIRALVRAAEQSATPEPPIRIRLKGQARQAASRVWAELIRHTLSGENIFQIV